LALPAGAQDVPTAAAGAESQSATGDDPAPRSPRIVNCRIGFHNHYKVGYWVPIWIDLAGTASVADPAIDITTTDSDGVATIMTVVPEAGATSQLAYIKIGRIGAPLEIALRNADERLDVQVFDPKGVSGGKSRFDP